VKRNQIKKHVKKRYSGLAKGKTSSCSSCCPCDYDAVEQSKAIGYSITDIEQIPKEAVKGLGCGNPTALADLIEGETVLDLGAGLGIDVFLASSKVGPKGFVIGVDMTMEKNAYKEIITEAGFRDVRIVSQNTYHEPDLAASLAGKITSVKIKAYK
jgi:arsenite methyltransferase